MMTNYSRLPFIIFIVFLLSAVDLFSQNIISEVDHDTRHRYDRITILTGGGPSGFHSSIYPYWRSDLVELVNIFSSGHPSEIDAHFIQNTLDQNNEFLMSLSGDKDIIFSDSSKTFYVLNETVSDFSYRRSKRPLWNTFYKTPAFLYQADIKDFYLRVNPMLQIGGGRETQEGVTTFFNQRGLSIRGGIGENVYFYTSLYDSQIRYPNFINEFTNETGVVPGAGLYKNYDSALFDFTQGRDFLIANAYVGVDFGKYIGLQLGHHQHFIGDGIRSLFLSDFSTPFFSLKFNTRIWKFHYQNIFAELSSDSFVSAVRPGMPIPKKYMAAHYLSFKPARNFTLGLFEAVVFDRDDHRFELQYLNPVILYRTVEGTIGSPDNVLLGLSSRWDLKRKFSFYGQFILDDILIREILNGNMDWWGNKFGHQLGVKYVNAFGIDQLDLQAEWNQVRPYTYSHYNENANYSNYKQALAHPLGANFNEWIGSVRYQISPRLGFQSKLFLMKKGEDGQDSISYGGNILAPNIQRTADYGHSIGQGVEADIVWWSTTLTYEISSGLYADLQYLYRNKKSELDTRDLITNFFQAGVRLNMARREDAF